MPSTITEMYAGPFTGTAQLLFILFTLTTIILFWKIFKKANFPPWFSLGMAIPFVNVLLLFYLAFSKWPDKGETTSSNVSPGAGKIRHRRIAAAVLTVLVAVATIGAIHLTPSGTIRYWIALNAGPITAAKVEITQGEKGDYGWGNPGQPYRISGYRDPKTGMSVALLVVDRKMGFWRVIGRFRTESQ